MSTSSFVTYTGDGLATQFVVPFPYLSRGHVSALVDGTPVTFTWDSGGLITISPAPAAGASVNIRRDTPRDAPIVDYANGNVVLEGDLDASAQQALYVAQEAFDYATAGTPVGDGNKGDISVSAGGMSWQLNPGAVDATALAPGAVGPGALAPGSLIPGKIEPGTGDFHSNLGENAQVWRLGDRLFVGKLAQNIGVEWLNPSGLSPAFSKLHAWGARDATLLALGYRSGLAIVGHAQTSDQTGFRGLPSNAPSAIGVSGFAINDVTTGSVKPTAWGLYADAVQFAGAGFTAGIEIAVAHLGANTAPPVQPFNAKAGAANENVGIWVASGAGLDAVGYDNSYGAPGNVSAGLVFVSSLADNSAKFTKGIVFADGAMVDLSGGAGIYEIIAAPMRHQISFYRSDGSQAGYFWQSAAPTAGATGIELAGNTIKLLAANGIEASVLSFGTNNQIGQLFGEPRWVVDAGNDYMRYDRGLDQYEYYINNVKRLGINQYAIDVKDLIAIDGTVVLGPRKAAVADASGGATVDAEARTAINTLLSRLRAHGLIAT